MSKYDCNKCFDYTHERKRMCEYEIEKYNGCDDNCKLYKFKSCVIPDNQEKIDTVQKWSDEHPEPHKKTTLEDFREKYPDAPQEDNNLPRVCIRDLYSTDEPCSFDCMKCWNRPLNEVQNEQ